MHIRKEDVLEYHASAPAGKISITPTKPCHTQRDLSLAYTPGVAIPCLEIAREPALAYRYTAKGNLVAVVTNGTSVLGLGNIGPLAGKPVMEGKGVLFKRFADIDVFDLELAASDPADVIRACQMLEPTFGAHQSRRHQGARTASSSKKNFAGPCRFQCSTTISTAPRSSWARRY